EAEEFVTLIKENKQESEENTFERSMITAKIMEEARKQMGIVYPADQA
ncbi:oxidoreductase, partial [Bacillus spizizenii]|nr:oxidoreductase [Bacillus spizizenii]